MMDESRSRSIEKSCIMYVRHVDNFEAKAAFYDLVDLDGSGNTNNIVKALTDMWKKDGLDQAYRLARGCGSISPTKFYTLSAKFFPLYFCVSFY